jgi:uroporphyrinogen-III synthase
MKMLIIRPQPGADATAALAQKAGIPAVTTPLFEVQPLPWDVPIAANYDAIMVTSANTFRHGGDGLETLRSLPVYAVGQATAIAARAAGFEVIWTGTEGANTLLTQATTDQNYRLLRLAGQHYHETGTPAEMTIDIRAVYHSAKLPPPASLIMNLSEPSLAALHSVRAAEYFSTICNSQQISKSAIAIAALSPEIAAAAGLGWADILVADAPNDEALLLKAKTYFTNVHCDP